MPSEKFDHAWQMGSPTRACESTGSVSESAISGRHTLNPVNNRDPSTGVDFGVLQKRESSTSKVLPSVYCPELRAFSNPSWNSELNLPVNKRDLSTRENGENVAESAQLEAFNMTRAGFSVATGRDTRVAKSLRNVWDSSEHTAGAMLSINSGCQFVLRSIGSPAWIRTTIHGSKGRCPTIRRPGNSGGRLPSV